MAWEPQAEAVQQICRLLSEYMSPGADQARILQQLQACAQFPDFNNYLAHILTRADSQQLEVRQSAGLLLKNNLKSAYSSMNPTFQTFLKAALLPALGSPDRQLRGTVGTVISVVVAAGRVTGWPDLFVAIAQCLDSGDYDHTEGALDALFKVCEDMPDALDVDIPGLQERPTNALIPRLLKLFGSPHPQIRRYAVALVNQFIGTMPGALVSNMGLYLQGLFSLSHDPSPEVRRLVCAGLVSLLDVQPDYLQPHMPSVIEYMLQATQDGDEEVALEACEFWSVFCEARLPVEQLRDLLPRLIPALMKNMVYADDDEAVIAAAEEEDESPDREQDMKPFVHRSRGAHVDAEGEEDDEDDEVNVWNLRKCSAASLDVLSNVFGDEILPILMPLVQARLADGSDAAWKEREAAILAVGAVAEGCIGGLMPHLPQLNGVLLQLLEDPRPLVRSIAAWTISRYCKWTLSQSAGKGPLEAVLMGLLRRILDPSKRVQEAACSAFATLEEEAAGDLAPHLEAILQHLMFAFGKYGRKNLRILYDAIGTLADAVGRELNDPKYVGILMPPLVAKWQRLADTDKDLFPLLECMTSIAQALGPGFAEYADPVFQRCVNIVQLMLICKAEAAAAAAAGGVPLAGALKPPAEYDKEFVVCALDLLSGVAEGMGASIESLVARSGLRDLLLQCCADEAPDVRQSAFALLGDLAKAAMPHLRSAMPEFLRLANRNLQVESVAHDTISACNNACWAIGEIAVKVRGDMAPHTLPIVASLVPLMTTTGVNKSILVNSAITLGRLGWVCPEQVAPHMEHFMLPWCQALRSIRDDVEKEHAYLGLCAMVNLNPGGAVNAFVQMCEAVASWQEFHSEDLRKSIGHILHGYKQMLGEHWPTYFSALPPAVRTKLSLQFKL